MLFFLFPFLTVFYLLTPLLHAELAKDTTAVEANNILSFPLLNFNTRIKNFTLGQTQEGQLYIDMTFTEAFNAYQGRPYFREDNFSLPQVISYIQHNPNKHFAFNFSLLEKNFSVSFRGTLDVTSDPHTLRLFLPKNPSSFPILSNLAELQKLLTSKPRFTLLFTILNYNVGPKNRIEESTSLYDRFNYLFYAEKGQTLEKVPPSSNRSFQARVTFKGVKQILVVPYEGPSQEPENIQTFINIWTKGTDNFQVSPPNGYVYTKDATGKYVRYDIRFLNPVYNPETQELTFDGQFLQNALTGEAAEPVVLKSEHIFTTSFPTFVAVDWKTQK